MLNYATLGANDMPASDRFYSALLLPLGYARRSEPEGLMFSAPGAVTLYVKPPFDGQPASVGNGSMLALQAPSHGLVRQLHAAAIAAGGSDEGAPGFRAEYSAHFFVAYVRDPVGNKFALFCNDPREGRRAS